MGWSVCRVVFAEGICEHKIVFRKNRDLASLTPVEDLGSNEGLEILVIQVKLEGLKSST